MSHRAGCCLVCASLMSCTTAGSASVEMSPNWSGWSSAILRNICLMIFPERVFGSPGTTCMKGREGGEGTSGASWGWGLTWEVALKGVCGKCALLASMCARCTKNFSSVRACVCPERCLRLYEIAHLTR